MKTKWLLLGIGAVVAVVVLAPHATPVVARKLKKVRDRIEDHRQEALVARMEEDRRQGRVH